MHWHSSVASWRRWGRPATDALRLWDGTLLVTAVPGFRELKGQMIPRQGQSPRRWASTVRATKV